MTNRTITTKDGMSGVETTNGIATWTASVFKLPMKAYKPLDNCFNAELAQAVLEIIHTHRALWRQTSWRTLMFDPPTAEAQRQVKALSAFEQDEKNPVCGTSMCFAGWVNELTHVDWVIDGEAIKKAQLDGSSSVLVKKDGMSVPGFVYDIGSWTDTILVRKSPEPPPVSYDKTWAYLPTTLKGCLATRGFTEATHDLCSVEYAARVALGLKWDILELFRADNSMDDIEKIVAYYTANGTQLTNAQLDFFFEDIGWSPSDRCMCTDCQMSRRNYANAIAEIDADAHADDDELEDVDC